MINLKDIKLFRILGLASSPKPAPEKKVRTPLPQIFFIVEMPDGQRLGGIYNKKTASWHKNRLIKAGGRLIQWIDKTAEAKKIKEQTPTLFDNVAEYIREGEDEGNNRPPEAETPPEKGEEDGNEKETNVE